MVLTLCVCVCLCVSEVNHTGESNIWLHCRGGWRVGLQCWGRHWSGGPFWSIVVERSIARQDWSFPCQLHRSDLTSSDCLEVWDRRTKSIVLSQKCLPIMYGLVDYFQITFIKLAAEQLKRSEKMTLLMTVFLLLYFFLYIICFLFFFISQIRYEERTLPFPLCQILLMTRPLCELLNYTIHTVAHTMTILLFSYPVHVYISRFSVGHTNTGEGVTVPCKAFMLLYQFLY